MSDSLIYYITNNTDYFYDLVYVNSLNRYGIDLDSIKSSKIILEISGTFDITEDSKFNKNYGSKRIKYINKDDGDDLKSNLLFSNIIKNSDEIDKILKDPNYIFTLNIDFNYYSILIKLVYLISLIHNNYNKFIIDCLTRITENSNYSFEENKIKFYVEEDRFLYEVQRMILSVPNEKFKSYIEFIYI